MVFTQSAGTRQSASVVIISSPVAWVMPVTMALFLYATVPVSALKNRKSPVPDGEGSVQVPGCMYISGAFSNPGTGTLKISALGSDQLARQTRSNGEPVLLKGSRFEAVFEVQSPATNNSGGFDTTPQYSGSGQFVSANTNYKGT